MTYEQIDYIILSLRKRVVNTMERINRPVKIEKISKQNLDKFNLNDFDFEGNPIGDSQPEPPVKKDIEWTNDKTVLKRGRIKVLRNKRQTKYSVEGLTKTEFNKLRDVL